MSKILSLAQDFEAKSKQQAQDTEQHLKSEFERHENFIKR
ncbi:MbeB family mobilization protein, partial [Vibrio ichthyoenteri]